MKEILNSGVYFIVNSVNELYYIGSSIDLSMRERTHFSNLKVNIHSNKHLQNAVNKYGLDNFEFKVVERVEPEQVLVKEQEYLDNADWSILYNMNRKVNTGGADFTKIRLVLLDLDGFVVEEFASGRDLVRYFGEGSQVNTYGVNTSAIYRGAYRIVTFDFFENHYSVITSWKTYTNTYKESVEERLKELNKYTTTRRAPGNIYRSAEAEKFAYSAF